MAAKDKPQQKHANHGEVERAIARRRKEQQQLQRDESAADQYGVKIKGGASSSRGRQRNDGREFRHIPGRRTKHGPRR